MEAMKIMGIPDEEQIGMNPLKGLKMQGNERGGGPLFVCLFVVCLGFFVGFVLFGVHSPALP